MTNDLLSKYSFPIDWVAIQDRIDQVNPSQYGRTRNFINGEVTYLSPYVSRGVISTRYIYEQVVNRGIDPRKVEKFIQELAWRDYWQQLWIARGDAIDLDLRYPQDPVANREMPLSLLSARTGIRAIDQAVEALYHTGYMHNHVRMYVAAIACNIGQSHWSTPARWMYYHLWDGDWASNALSWQWVAGTNSNKSYVANQANINKYCHTRQSGTFLDVSYAAFSDMPVPDVLQETKNPELRSYLPTTPLPDIDAHLPTLIYNYYNLDPQWRSEEQANRIVLLEPDIFNRYPVSPKSLNFALRLARGNIDGVQIYTGTFEQLRLHVGNSIIYFKEHPLNRHYRGVEEPRTWMTDVKGEHRSFFAFWKKAKRQLLQ